jgi:DNA-binding CsgD family transcriptional regulator
VTAESAGAVTVQAAATRAAGRLPFGAVAPLLAGDAPDPGAVDERVDLLRRTVAALADRSEQQPLILFVDDAHLLDDASATLVHQVAATGAATVLATVQVGAPSPDPVVALWKDGIAERIEVPTLPPEAVEELLGAVLGGLVDPATVLQFVERSRGNALFLRELVTGALDDGSLADHSGLWRLGEDLSPSARLAEIVEARLGHLDEEERAVLELVAYGEPLGHAELAALADPAVAESLERRGLLTSTLEGRRLMVHLAHPLYGDVVREHTPALRARAIAAELADAVEATGPSRRDDVLRVATWRLAAGEGHPDVMLRGALIARCRHDFPLAERLARAASDAGIGPEATLLAAEMAGLQGRTDEAEEELAGLAAALATPAGQDETAPDGLRARVALARFDNAVVFSGRDDVATLDEASATITDPVWLDQLDARRAGVALNAEGPDAGVAAALPIAERASGDGLVFACVIGAYGLARQGRLDDALALSARGRAAQDDAPTPPAWYPWWHAVTDGVALLYAGRFDEADEVIAVHHEQAVAEGSAEAQSVFAALAAASAGERGRVRTAARRAREAVTLDERMGRPLLVRQGHILAARALAHAGQADEAAEELAALDALGLPPIMRDEVDLLQARAWTAATGGDMPRARGYLEQAAELGEELGDLVGRASALHGLARLGQAAEACDRLFEVTSRIDGDLAPCRARHAEVLARGDAAGLEKVSDDFEALGADLLAAEASADAAVARRQAGEVREAAADERRTAILVERCEGAVTPALQATEARARLTPAERETAVLAAGGRANKEIAEQLFLSPRTVENRLQRVYEKLGVSGRTELTSALATADE